MWPRSPTATRRLCTVSQEAATSVAVPAVGRVTEGPKIAGETVKVVGGVAEHDLDHRLSKAVDARAHDLDREVAGVFDQRLARLCLLGVIHCASPCP